VPVIIRVASLFPAGLLLLATPLAAQIKTGDFSNSLSGTVTSGYSAESGNQTASDHGWTVGGVTNLNGFFYNPNFINYTGTVFLNQSRANSDFQSISDSSGLSLSSNIFGGSKFPGAVSYSKSYNSEGNYGIPGISDFVTHGNNDDFGVAWSLNLPKLPSVSADLNIGNDNYSVYGTNTEGETSFHSVNLHSTYTNDGYNLTTFYSSGSNDALIPSVISGSSNSKVETSTNGYGIGLSHNLPLDGSFSANANRSHWNTGYLGNSSTGTVDMASVFASIRPAEKLTMSGSIEYSDDLAGQLIEDIVSQGAAAPIVPDNSNSYSFDSEIVASYVPRKDIQATIFAERRAQRYDMENYGANSYGGSITYTRQLANGVLNSSVTFVGNTGGQNSADSLGFATTLNYSNEIKGWHVNGTFGYAQNMQTLLVTYLNSSYNYSVNVHRKFGKVTFSSGGGASKTALTDQPGTSSSSESGNASLGYGSWINANAGYSRSNGLALETGAGLVSVPVPSPTVPSDLISLYGGKSVSAGLSSAPVRGLTMSASYAKSNSNTSSSGFSSYTQNSQYNALIQYQIRKLGFSTGYARLEQGFGGTVSSQPAIVSSYFAGITRWFNFF